MLSLRKNNKEIVCVLLICSICSCNIDNGPNIIEENGRMETNESNDWKNDSCGCLRLRSITLAQSLIEDNNLLNRSIYEFKEVFGEPNNTWIDGDIIYLHYYFNSICDEENHLREESDKCWIEFIFEEGLLKEIPRYYDME